MKKKISLVCLVIFIVICVIPFYTSKYSLEVNYYTIDSDEISQSIRIVQLTDLHNSEFGTDNEKLITAVKEQSPDVIMITGDLLDYHDEDTSIAIHVIEELSQYYPVYISLGNHELEYEERYDIDIETLYEAAGAIVLEQNYIDTEINGQEVRIGGIYGYCLPPNISSDKQERFIEQLYVNDFQNTDRYTILMCHMPVSWVSYGAIDEWNVDCILTGHVHGGQIIIPFIGGLYAPDFGYFPGYLQGMYDSEDGTKHVIVSRGLGSTELVPRWNNTPEVVVLDIQ